MQSDIIFSHLSNTKLQRKNKRFKESSYHQIRPSYLFHSRSPRILQHMYKYIHLQDRHTSLHLNMAKMGTNWILKEHHETPLWKPVYKRLLDIVLSLDDKRTLTL